MNTRLTKAAKAYIEWKASIEPVSQPYMLEDSFKAGYDLCRHNVYTLLTGEEGNKRAWERDYITRFMWADWLEQQMQGETK